MSNKFCFIEFENGVVVINTTPHEIAIQDMNGNVLMVPTSVLVNAAPVEVPYNNSGLFVTTEFHPTEGGQEVIDSIRKEYDSLYPDNDKHKLVIIGSIIAAQAYPGQVAGMVPVPGFERVAPNEKRMRCDKFTMYPMVNKED